MRQKSSNPKDKVSYYTRFVYSDRLNDGRTDGPNWPDCWADGQRQTDGQMDGRTKQKFHSALGMKTLSIYEPAHEIMRILARAFAVRIHKVWK